MPEDKEKTGSKAKFDDDLFSTLCDKVEDDDFLDEVYGVTDEEYDKAVEVFISGRKGSRAREK